jgi:prepilin-type N-terminal cleavage/methylation domain-containing protein
LSYRKQGGFTLVELLVTMTIIGIVSMVFYTVFNSTITRYFIVQREGSNFTDLAQQTQRIGKVLRSLTDITAASSTEITIYAYFAPTDTYVSQIHYYKNAASTAILADVTQMTANPPVGTLIPATLKTYTVFDNYKQVSGVNLFIYLDSAGAALTTPISDLRTIKGIRINLAVADATKTGNQSMSLDVSLRNRKTNL